LVIYFHKEFCEIISKLCDFEAFGKLSLSIIASVADNKTKSTKKIDEENFMINIEPQIYPAMEIFINNWLKSKSRELREDIIQSIGQMIYLLNEKKLQDSSVKIITTYMATLKKPDVDKLFLTEVNTFFLRIPKRICLTLKFFVEFVFCI
jgi:hypothetical protein